MDVVAVVSVGCGGCGCGCHLRLYKAVSDAETIFDGFVLKNLDMPTERPLILSVGLSEIYGEKNSSSLQRCLKWVHLAHCQAKRGSDYKKKLSTLKDDFENWLRYLLTRSKIRRLQLEVSSFLFLYPCNASTRWGAHLIHTIGCLGIHRPPEEVHHLENGWIRNISEI